jgi:hypothetical protein
MSVGSKGSVQESEVINERDGMVMVLLWSMIEERKVEEQKSII